MRRQHRGYMDWSPKNKNVYDSTFGVGGGHTLLAMFDTRFQLDDTQKLPSNLQHSATWKKNRTKILHFHELEALGWLLT